MLRRSSPSFQYINSSHVQGRLQTVRQEQFRQIDRSQKASARFAVDRVAREARSENGTFIGIDLGTTNSCVSYIDPVSKKPRIIPSPTGSWVFPTAITFDRNHQVRLFGEEARGVARTSASATLCSGKRLIGRRYGELSRVTDQMSKTNTLTFDEAGAVSVECAGRVYNVTHVTGMFLRYLKNCAEEFLKQPVEAAVVSVPAHFSPMQKVATEDAALIAGFDVLEIIDEPSAACLAYTVLRPDTLVPEKSKAGTDVETSIVFDLGGGTLDCALMDHDQSSGRFALVTTHGDPLLGGNDWDNVIARHIASLFERKWRVNLDDQDANPGKVAADQRVILTEAERCKVHFTHSMENYRGFNRAFHFSEKHLDVLPLEVNISWKEYCDLTEHLRERCVLCLNRIFDEAKRDPANTDNILLVGAMTRDPPIRSLLERYFGRSPSATDMCPADYAVAIGAAIRGGMLRDVFEGKLNNKVTFVHGSLQHLKDGGLLARAWTALSGKGAGSDHNPNAIGHKWRGSTKGMADEEIEKFAREIVEFEAACERRLLLERIENDANQTIQRIGKNAAKRQGLQEKSIAQYSEQLKFWQYMVRNFHDHEEQLERTIKEATVLLDKLEGVAPDVDDAQLDSDGRIDFAAAKKAAEEKIKKHQDEQVISKRPPLVSDEILDGKTPVTATPTRAKPMAEPPMAVPGPDGDVSLVYPESHEEYRERIEKAQRAAEEPDPSMPHLAKKSKVIRREKPGKEIPLPDVARAREIIDKGTTALFEDQERAPQLSENTRRKLLQDFVEERVWREPPKPPGEKGSWLEVRDALARGENVGARETETEIERSQFTADEVFLGLIRDFPVVVSDAELETNRLASATVEK